MTTKLTLKTAIVLVMAFGHIMQPLIGQEDETDTEIYELNPFEVSTDADIGYYASSSMAGTRLNTDLRDIASSVQVVTQEFMEDIGATGLDTLMQYTTGTETAGIQGNFVGYSTPNGDQTNSVGPRANIGNTQRIRGLGNPDKTRNFFKTSIPFDSYNTTRVDINRGANSFLFGLGSPAGLVNANLKTALFQDMGEISVRIGEGGEHPSSRISLDYNKELVEDVLAIRFAALFNDTQFRQKPTFYEDERFYTALTYKPFENTTFRAHYETVETDANPADVLLPQENLSMFLDAPNGLARLSIDVVDNVRQFGSSEGPLNNTPTGNALRNYNSGPQAYHYIWDGMKATNVPDYARVNGVRGGAARQPEPPAYWNTNDTTRRPWVYYVKHGNYRDYNGVGHIQRGFLNLDTFDFTKRNLGNNNDFVERDFENFNLSLEQLFFDGNAGFELAFDRQEYQQDNWIVFHAGAEHVFMDINETLLIPDPNGDGLMPLPNPNYGRPAIMTQSWREDDTSEQDSQRFSGFIRHDFRDNVDGFFGKILGRHQLTALADRVETDAKSVSRRFASYPAPGTPDDQSTNASNVTTRYDRQLFQTVYVGPPQLEAFTNPSFTLADFQLEPITADLTGHPKGYVAPVTFWNVEENGWDQGTVEGRWVPSNSQRLSYEEVTSFALNSQSHFLDDMVVVNLGWREDEVIQKLRINDAPVVGDTRSVDPRDWNLNQTPETELTNEIFGWGVVLNWPKQWIKTPDWFDMSLHYNDSENFVPAAGLQDYLGNTLPVPTGVSKDYGFTLYLFDNKFVTRVNWFEGALANSGNYWRQVNGIVADAVNAYGNLEQEIIQVDANGDKQIDEDAGDEEFRTNERLAQTYQARDFLLSNLDPRALAIQQFTQDPTDGSFSSNWAGAATTDLHDNKSDGLEVEFIANPTKNWRVAINVSKYETVLANIAPRLTEFIEAVTIPYVQQFGDLVYGSPSRIDGETSAEQMNDKLFSFYADKAAEGTPSQEQRKWNFSLISNYRFDEGRFKGFSVGGAYRWQDSYAYGYPLTQLNGIVIPDVNNPHMSPTESGFDVWFGYGKKILSNIDWKVQLNIRNVDNWSSNDVTIIRVQPDGAPARARFDPPREIFLTNTFKF